MKQPAQEQQEQILGNLFEIAGGSVQGRDHDRIGLNNQDAFAWSCTERAIVAVVCDGCGSGAHNEVGAWMGARLTVQILKKLTEKQAYHPSEDLMEHVRQLLLVQLVSMIKAMGGESNIVIQDFFLFTIVGFIIQPETAAIFTLGDGVFTVNGHYVHIKYPGNAPPYIGYGFLPQNSTQKSCLPSFKIHWEGRPEDIKSILIGTDGVDDLCNSSDKTLPGKTEIIGELSQFWMADAYFTNPYAVQRRLALINRISTRYDPATGRIRQDSGRLSDDTTFIVLRRKS